MPLPTWALTVNGQQLTTDDVPPDRTLLDVLRARRLVGTKEGCGDGDCGACTVAVATAAAAVGVDGGSEAGAGDDRRPRYEAVNSCILPVGAVAGRRVVTVEGLADGDRLHPVQQAMVDEGGSQCGYCTPGFVMSLFAGYYDEDARTGAGGDHAGSHPGLGDDVVEGNLCRCTGYLPIRRAARSLPRPAAGDGFLDVPGGDPPPLPPEVRGADGVWHRPATVDDAVRLLADHPDAVVVAGATDLGLEMSHGRRRFPVVVAVDGIAEMQALRVTGDSVDVGAAAPLTRVERRLGGALAPLDEMLRWFAARQTRNRATLGGNLGTASPIGDLAPVLLAHDALVHLAGPDGERIVPIDELFTGYRRTVRRPDELIVSARLRRGPATTGLTRHARSAKVGKRGTDDISIVAACFALDLDPDGVVRHARLAYGGVAATPVRVHDVEAALVGRPLDPDLVADARAALAAAVAPIDDHRASADYRRALTGGLFARFARDVMAGSAS